MSTKCFVFLINSLYHSPLDFKQKLTVFRVVKIYSKSLIQMNCKLKDASAVSNSLKDL